MKFKRLMVLGLSLVASLGWGRASAQEGLRTLEQNLVVPAEPPAAPAAARESGYMGLTVDLMAPDGKSVYIVSVVENGPAAQGGLKADDVIMEINRQKIGNLQDLDGVVRQPPGAKLEFKVRRDNVPQRYEVTLGTRPSAAPVEPTVDELPPPAPAADPRSDATTPAPRTDGAPSVLHGSRPNLGIKVADAERLSDAEKRRFGVVVDTGAMISGISAGTPAAQAGLPIGGVVVSVNGIRIGNSQDIVDVVRTFRPGEQIEVTYWEGDRVGRKKVRVGRTAVAVTPAAPTDGAAATADPRLRPRRRGSERPILNALERILDDVLPPGPDSRPAGDALPSATSPEGAAAPAEPVEAMVPPPPPARDAAVVESPELELEPPSAVLPVPKADEAEVNALRTQAVEMQKQLEILLQRIKELESKKKPAGRSPGQT